MPGWESVQGSGVVGSRSAWGQGGAPGAAGCGCDLCEGRCGRGGCQQGRPRAVRAGAGAGAAGARAVPARDGTAAVAAVESS